MPRPTVTPDLNTSHYTRVAGTGEAANRVSTALLRVPDAPTQPKETTMTRMFMTVAVLALAISAAQAEDSLASRTHDAAVRACAVKIGASRPITMYRGFTEYCVNRVSADALAKYQANASAKAEQRSTFAQK